MVGDAGLARFALLQSGVLGINSCARPPSTNPRPSIFGLAESAVVGSTNFQNQPKSRHEAGFLVGRGCGIRTHDLGVPNAARYQAALIPGITLPF